MFDPAKSSPSSNNQASERRKSGLQVTALDTKNNPVTTLNDFTFYVTFASAGSFTGTVTTPPVVHFNDNSTFSGPTNVTFSGETTDTETILSGELFNATEDLGPVTVSSDGTWTYSDTLEPGSYDDLNVTLTELRWQLHYGIGSVRPDDGHIRGALCRDGHGLR